jgi:hypothetical protein
VDTVEQKAQVWCQCSSQPALTQDGPCRVCVCAVADLV